jgi:hypothetical protein
VCGTSYRGRNIVSQDKRLSQGGERLYQVPSVLDILERLGALKKQINSAQKPLQEVLDKQTRFKEKAAEYQNARELWNV